MAQSHNTERERERECEAMGYYILCRSIHTTPGQGTGPDTIVFHTNFSVPGPTFAPIPSIVQCD